MEEVKMRYLFKVPRKEPLRLYDDYWATAASMRLLAAKTAHVVASGLTRRRVEGSTVTTSADLLVVWLVEE